MTQAGDEFECREHRLFPNAEIKIDMTVPSIIVDIVYQFAASPFDWYAARSSGLYRSTDHGTSWQPAYASLGAATGLTTLCVTTASGFDQSSLVFAGLSGELLRSTDGGESWEILQRPSPAPVFTSLAPSPHFASDGKLFAGTMEDGVLLYENHGETWTMWNFGLLDTNVLCLAVSPAFAEDRTLFVGVQSGLFRSANGGLSWQEIDLGIGYGAVLCLALSSYFAEDGLIYAGLEDGGLLRSTDGGYTWQRVSESTLTESVNSITLSNESNILVHHGESLLVSGDGGETWVRFRPDQIEGQEVTAVLAPEGLTGDVPVLIGTSDGAIRVV